MKYFKLDKDKREIIIDKYKKYNVNIDILNLIIDLKCENDRLNNIIDKQDRDITTLTKDKIKLKNMINGDDKSVKD